MPLSEHEQRLLDEMERNLYQGEADVLTALGAKRVPHYRAIAVGVILAVVGLITMLVGVYQDLTVVGILGFAVVFTGVMVAVAVPGRATSSPKSSASSSSRSSSAPSTSFMDRLNDRWERRQRGENP
ncbi:MAG: hypothetical protein ABR66_03945 [Microbacteriaceae bacterium BACL25 MAG-120322-bin65]|jgi:predicted signal transduction protein with EAL and GGDEF domain|nr:MAG: hypothetical protein ABR66_03945 [Microbacteriaceae bacterium BACL25 MAG-120322-bin65]